MSTIIHASDAQPGITYLDQRSTPVRLVRHTDNGNVVLAMLDGTAEREVTPTYMLVPQDTDESPSTGVRVSDLIGRNLDHDVLPRLGELTDAQLEDLGGRDTRSRLASAILAEMDRRATTKPTIRVENAPGVVVETPPIPEATARAFGIPVEAILPHDATPEVVTVAREIEAAAAALPDNSPLLATPAEPKRKPRGWCLTCGEQYSLNKGTVLAQHSRLVDFAADGTRYARRQSEICPGSYSQPWPETPTEADRNAERLRGRSLFRASVDVPLQIGDGAWHETVEGWQGAAAEHEAARPGVVDPPAPPVEKKSDPTEPPDAIDFEPHTTFSERIRGTICDVATATELEIQRIAVRRGEDIEPDVEAVPTASIMDHATGPGTDGASDYAEPAGTTPYMPEAERLLNEIDSLTAALNHVRRQLREVEQRTTNVTFTSARLEADGRVYVEGWCVPGTQIVIGSSQ